MHETSSARKLLPILLLLLANVTGLTMGQQKDLGFESLPLGQGAATHVSYILQDRTGFIWIAAWSGLHRYDGYSFITYKHDPSDTCTIAVDGLSTLYEDKIGTLWIGSWQGLERFDRATSTFKHYTPNPIVPGSDPSNNVCAICEDRNGTLWVGTWGGLYQFDRVTETFTSMRHDRADPGSIAHNSVQVIYEDREKFLWFGTAAGLDKYDFAKGQFVHCTSVPPESRALSVNRFAEYSIMAILEDDEGMIWLGTNRGLVEYNPKEGTSAVYAYTSPRVDVLEYVRTGINTICRDPASSALLVATTDGLFAFKKGSELFERRAAAIVTSICVERSGTLLLGTDTGIQKLNMVKQPFVKYPMEDIACGPTLGRDGVLWVFGYRRGYHKFDTRAKRFVPYAFGGDYLAFVHLPENGGSLALLKRDGTVYFLDSLGNKVFTMDGSARMPGVSSKEYRKSWSFACETPRGYYVGTHAGPLLLFDPRTNGVSELFTLNQSICWIQRDRYEYLWVATLGGRLVRYDPGQDTLVEYFSDARIPSSWNGKPVNWASEGRKWGLWFGTTSGLLKYDRRTDSFVHFTERNGLPSNNIRGVAEDDHGTMWVSTTKGISKLDPETGQVKNYDGSYGLDPAADIYLGGVVKDVNGEMYAGGTNGLTWFHPDSIRDNPFVPPIVITSFKKFDKAYPISKEVQLPYDENFISFEFAALNYISPERNQYAYKMEGVDRDWVFSGTRRYASYPNLPPGEYIFRVKGSNNEGVWNEAGTSVAIVISPPWWKSSWAYAFYILALFSMGYATWSMQMRRIRVRHELEMNKFEAAKLHEVDELKSRFFANISHEFRTPLTLIMGPVRRMQDAEEDRQKREDLNLVHKNATRLLELVNQLLDLSRLESGSMKLKAAPEDIVPLLMGLLQSFCSYAERKKITTVFTSSHENLIVYIDRDKIQKIITNVLGNAFKFTPEGGRIEMSVARDAQEVSIRISDTGIGIPASKLPRIFDRFYQVDGTRTREQEGTGIGLSLTRELVELHRGTIKVESEEGRGSVFTIRLPLGQAHLLAEEICTSDKAGESRRIDGAKGVAPASLTYTPQESPPGEAATIPVKEKGKPVLLIVEDNADVRQYIRRDLEAEYSIVEAVDGADGWTQSFELMPDIIVSDVMMPKMDGFALCDRLKTDERTSHIPVVLLTAKASSQDKIEGFRTGADDYIMKPFEEAELRARLRNLLEQRKRLHEHFRKHGLFEIAEQKITSVDQKFLEKALSIITDRMSERAFGVEILAEQMAVSRSLLLKKMEALTGEAPVDLIKRTRLNRAAKLLDGGFGNTFQVALEVGFSSPSYFTKCFRKQFGVNPSEYHRPAVNPHA